MKKLICLWLCMSLFVIASIISVYSDEGEDSDSLGLISSPIIQTQSIDAFVEGQTGTFTIIFEVDGIYQILEIVEHINYVCEYINVPYTTNRVEAYRILNEFSSGAIAYVDDSLSESFPYAEMIRSASVFYNCHSYAWYSTSASNVYWIDDPEMFFWYNSSYEEVTTPAVGDIICYYDGSINLHSGIVTAVNVESSNGRCGNANTVEVISKWGCAGLYAHNGYECPYTTYVEHTAENPAATTVKYYRYHSHAFTYLNVTANYQHRATCRICGYTFTETHTWKLLLDGSQKCLKCGVTTTGHVVASTDEDKDVTAKD